MMRFRALRTPMARQFDRNCVLASTAGQLVAAYILGLPVAAIVVGTSPFEVGTVAKDIRLAAPAADLPTSIVAAAGSLAFGLAAGLSSEDLALGLQGRAQDAMATAAALLTPWIDDGRLARLVAALDAFRLTGERRFDG